MAKTRLTDRTIKGLSTDRKQEDFWDDRLDGFGVRVSGITGGKTFVLRYQANGTRRRLKLGTYPIMSLARAREKAKDALLDVQEGLDPAAESDASAAEAVVTFGALAEQWMERHAKPNKAPKSVYEDQRQLDHDLLPAWKDRPADAIRRADVRAVLNAIVDRGAGVQANRTLALVSTIYNWGLDEELVEQNPAARFRKPTKERTRQRVLSTDEIRRVWNASLAERRLMGATFRLRLLTGQRGKEVHGMRHADLDGAWWTIPAAMSKTDESHRVYLSDQARAVLEEIARLNRKSEWIFPSRGGHIRNINKAAQSIRDASRVRDFRPHDLRRTAATGMASLGVPRFIIGKVLNHADRTTTSIYDRASYDDEKREALETWGAHVEALLDA